MNLPEGFARAGEYISNVGLPNNTANIVQLFPDIATSTWRYLFAPSQAGFGHHIDQYVDLSDGTLHRVSSPADFIRRFSGPSGDSDDLKYLVSPTRYHR
jgi:hypothetical protein